jgi:micrococcal nuclease
VFEGLNTRTIIYWPVYFGVGERMKKSVLILIVVIALIAGSYIVFIGFPSSDSEEFEVAQVIDGDTIKLKSGQKVRLIGINTPETGHPYYNEATEKLKELIGDSKVTLKSDIENKDQYGRLLRYVYVNDTFVNMEIVKAGLATAYEFEPNVKYASEFDAAESQARIEGVGIWTPSSYSLTLTQLNYDAEGDDNNNLNGEFIVFTNEGNISLELTGWMVLDEANNEYFFPSFSLGNGSSVTLYIGSGTDSSTELYWGSTKSIWNNGGDELYLRDSQGYLVVFFRY